MTTPRFSSARRDEDPARVDDAAARVRRPCAWRTAACRSPPGRCGCGLCAGARRQHRCARSARARSPCGRLRPRCATRTGRLDLAIDLREPRLDRIGIGLSDDALLGEHPGVRDRTADVLGPHALVDRQRRAELLQKRPGVFSNRPPQGVLASAIEHPAVAGSLRPGCPRVGCSMVTCTGGRAPSRSPLWGSCLKRYQNTKPAHMRKNRTPQHAAAVRSLLRVHCYTSPSLPTFRR